MLHGDIQVPLNDNTTSHRSIMNNLKNSVCVIKTLNLTLLLSSIISLYFTMTLIFLRSLVNLGLKAL